MYIMGDCCHRRVTELLGAIKDNMKLYMSRCEWAMHQWQDGATSSNVYINVCCNINWVKNAMYMKEKFKVLRGMTAETNTRGQLEGVKELLDEFAVDIQNIRTRWGNSATPSTTGGTPRN